MFEKKDYFVFAFIIAAAFLVYRYLPGDFSQEQVSDSWKDHNYSLAEPLQNNMGDAAKFNIKKGGWTFTLSPLASYQMEALVVGKTYYYIPDDFFELSPLDLSVVWGPAANSDFLLNVRFSQAGRGSILGFDSAVDEAVLAENSANNHIIPADGSVEAFMQNVAVGSVVFLEGYLVDVEGAKDGKKISWQTSLSRLDYGMNSCEVFYVQRAAIRRS